MWDRLANRAGVKRGSVLIGGAVGFAFFLIAFGSAIIHPHYVEWLLENNNQDSIQHFVGWEFFRNEPWHFPLGKIQNYGYPVVTSIVYTDSIPFLALFFKCFSFLLPEKFQYFGIWYAACFFLQGLFAWALASYATKNNLLKFGVTLFFLSSPIMLNRMIEHQALVAHWVILAGFLLYVRPYKANTQYHWLLLNVFTVLIHAYLALMVIAIWIASLMKESVLSKKMTDKQAMLSLLINIGSMLLVAWVCGYFVIPFASIMDAGGYGMNSMNLLAPFKPGQGSFVYPGDWSRFIMPFASLFIEQGEEGFNYLGFGMVSLLIISCYCLIKKMPTKKIAMQWVPLIFICFLFATYALSNNIYIGQYKLFSYSLPKYAFFITDMFRASGRFFWPAYYFLMMMVFFILNRRIKTSLLIPLISICLVFQILDLSIKIKALHTHFSRPTFLQTYFNVELTQNAKTHYSHLVFLPPLTRPHTKIMKFGQYIHYAATHGMSVNLGYFARQNNKDYLENGKQFLIKAMQGQFFKDTIYIIIDPHVAYLIKKRLNANDRFVMTNSYMIIFPYAKMDG